MKSDDVSIDIFMQRCTHLIKTFSSVINIYLSDYFITKQDHFLPQHWNVILKDLSLCDLVYLLQSNDDSYNKPSRVLPLWLLSYRSACHSLYLNNRPQKTPLFASPDFPHDLLSQDEKVFSSHVKVNDQLPNSLRRHIKPKKEHEILRQAELIARLYNVAEANHVVDIGAGQGHLSRLLSLGYGVKVTCIEGSSHHTPKATKFDSEANYSMNKHGARNGENVTEDSLPRHRNAMIQPGTTLSDFSKMIQNGAEPLIDTDVNRFLLTCLHACGDLTPTVLRLFTKLETSCCLATVGCCYMKTADPCGGGVTSFPLSDAGEKLELDLSYETLEAACHFIDGYKEKLILAAKRESINDDESLSNDKNHSYSLAGNQTNCSSVIDLIRQSYRPALQMIIAGRKGVGPKFGSVRCGSNQTKTLDRDGSFSSYASVALSRLDLDPQLTRAELKHADDTIAQRWMELVRFHCLRLMLAPVVETLILLDRLMYLRESKIPCALYPLFDPTISPRNLIIVAFKS